MEVTEIRVFLADEERLKAYVTVTFNDCFVVRDLKVINGNGGLFVAMPSKKKKDGTYKDIAHPINSDFRNYLEKKILDKYNDEYKMIEAGFPIKKVADYENDVVNPIASNPMQQAAYREHEAGLAPEFKK